MGPESIGPAGHVASFTPQSSPDPVFFHPSTGRHYGFFFPHWERKCLRGLRKQQGGNELRRPRVGKREVKCEATPPSDGAILRGTSLPPLAPPRNPRQMELGVGMPGEAVGAARRLLETGLASRRSFGAPACAHAFLPARERVGVVRQAPPSGGAGAPRARSP